MDDIVELVDFVCFLAWPLPETPLPKQMRNGSAPFFVESVNSCLLSTALVVSCIGGSFTKLFHIELGIPGTWYTAVVRTLCKELSFPSFRRRETRSTLLLFVVVVVLVVPVVLMLVFGFGAVLLALVVVVSLLLLLLLVSSLFLIGR